MLINLCNVFPGFLMTRLLQLAAHFAKADIDIAILGRHGNPWNYSGTEKVCFLQGDTSMENMIIKRNKRKFTRYLLAQEPKRRGGPGFSRILFASPAPSTRLAGILPVNDVVTIVHRRGQ